MGPNTGKTETRRIKPTDTGRERKPTGCKLTKSGRERKPTGCKDRNTGSERKTQWMLGHKY